MPYRLLAALLFSFAAFGQEARPRFDVATIKPSGGCEAVPRAGNLSPSPGRLELPCINLANLLQMAFGTFGDGRTINPRPLEMKGGPSWMSSEFFSFSGKAEGPVRTEILGGPMLQVFLEEQFHLKTHLESKEAPVYAMSVAKGGLKVQPLAEDACAPLDLSHPPPPPTDGKPPKICGIMTSGPGDKGGMKLDVLGSTMAQLAQRLSMRLDRPVVDETGVPGKFNFHVEFAPDPTIRGQMLPAARDGAAPPADPLSATDQGPTLPVALQEQLGLKLSAAKGTVPILVIDHVEKPVP
jgi:uncharacterized protein (TIGR03435 family)